MLRRCHIFTPLVSREKGELPNSRSVLHDLKVKSSRRFLKVFVFGARSSRGCRAPPKQTPDELVADSKEFSWGAVTACVFSSTVPPSNTRRIGGSVCVYFPIIGYYVTFSRPRLLFLTSHIHGLLFTAMTLGRSRSCNRLLIQWYDVKIPLLRYEIID